MPSKTQSILLAGVAVGVAASIFSLIPVAGGCLACLAVIGAGIMAVWHYTNTHQLTITGGQGAGLGALAGIVAAIVAGLIGQLFALLGFTPGFREALEQGFAESGMDPAQAEQFQEMFSSPLFFVGAMLIGLILYAILGAIGGAIGASMFKKGEEPAI